jgi:hypothetical protein
MNTDPVKHCDLYKDEGCAHVDGFLCDYETCEMRLDYHTEKILRKALLRSGKVIHKGFLRKNPEEKKIENPDFGPRK